MRIAYVTPAVNKASGTNMFFEQILERVAWEHEVTVFSTLLDAELIGRVEFQPILSLAPRAPNLLKYLSFLSMSASVLKKRLREFDVVHSTGGDCFYADMITSHFCQRQRMSLVWNKQIELHSPTRFHKMHTYLYMGLVSIVEKQQYMRKDLSVITAVSHGLSNELKRQYGVDPGKIRVIPNGVDLDRFHPRNRAKYRQRIRQDLDILDPDFVLVFVGGDWGRKGLLCVLEAMCLLRDRPVKLIVAGEDRSRLRFTKWVEAAGILPQVKFVGHRSDVTPFLAAADAFILPSAYEAFSVAMLEAASAGLPLLVTRINGSEELIEDGANGIFISRDALDIAEKIHLLASRQDFCLEISRNARCTVERRYSWDRIAGQLNEIYLQMGHHAAQRNEDR